MSNYKKYTVLILAGILGIGVANAQDEAASLDDLLQKVRTQSGQVVKDNDERMTTFLRQRNQQRQRLNQTKNELRAAEARSDRLKAAFDANERALEELEEAMRIRVGDMGELFGHVRQVAGDTKGIIEASLISAQYPERSGQANTLSQTTGLPNIDDLNVLRTLLMEEMVESGKVVRFPTAIVTATGESLDADVVRVGVFNAITEDKFLSFDANTGNLKELPRQPKDRFRSLAADLSGSSGSEDWVGMAVDPTRGSLLALLIQAPGFKERIQQGGTVGYVIIGLGIIGLILAILRIVVLTDSGKRIGKQLKSDNPDDGNALGRILSVYHDNKDIDTETLELKLDEAILKETPSLEKNQGAIKVLAAVAPLLGLLGTVVGMIATFQSITLFGTGDPKLMAGGISQALMTTVLGLVVAIPLVLMHAIVAGKSKSLIEILEQQSAGLIARHSENEEAS